MFSIESMQDILINLNGEDNLFKLFDTQRPRKRTPNIKSSKEKPPTFNIQRIWILPGHIFTLSGEEKKKELLAYDQLPKLGPYAGSQQDLLSPILEGVGVFDVYYTVENKQEFVFIVLKSGTVLIWAFKKPAFRWKHIWTYTLCKGKRSQIVSVVYNEHEKVFVWCEKRSSSQCCVCFTYVTFSEDDDVSISNIQPLLHNCLPITVHRLSHGMFSFVPLSPVGLLLFWSIHTRDTVVHMWGDIFNKQSISVDVSDFQSIVTTCISLWINSSTNENRIIAMTTHPTTRELVILQNNLQLFLIKGCERNKVEAFYISSLEVMSERDYFAKRVLKIYSLQRFLIVLLVDGIINIFDFRGGLFLWKTETFKSNSLNIWIRQGSFPTAGVWNKSGIWMLRSKSITDQILEFQSSRTTNGDKSFNLQKPNDVEFALDVFEEQKKSHRNKSKRRIKQGVNRSTEVPVHYLFQVLNQWQLGQVSTEIALSLSVKIKEVLRDVNTDEDVDLDELMCILDEIKDPTLLLVLFTDKIMPVCVKRRLMHKIRNSLLSSSTKNIDKKILSILHQFVQIEKDIVDCFESLPVENVMPNKKDILKEEFKKLERVVYVQSPNVLTIEKSLVNISKLNELSFIQHLSLIMLYKEKYKEEREFADLLWKTVLSRYTSVFDTICTLLWKYTPTMLLEMLKKAKCYIEANSTKEILTMNVLMSKVFHLVHLPAITVIDDDSDIHERICTYCGCLQINDLDSGEEDAYDIYIQFNFIKEALDTLRKYVDNSGKHYSMFFKLFTMLIRTRQIGQYVDDLKELTPGKFNMAEVYNVLCNQSMEMGGGPVFVRKSNDLCMGMFEPLFSAMLK